MMLYEAMLLKSVGVWISEVLDNDYLISAEILVSNCPGEEKIFKY